MSEPKEYYRTIDDISVNFVDQRTGKLAVRQTDKFVIAQYRSWALLLFHVLKLEDGKLKPRVIIRRYRNTGGNWRQIAGVNMTPEQLIRGGQHAESLLPK